MEQKKVLRVHWAEENLPELENRVSSDKIVPFPVRKKALEQLASEGLPTPKTEDWRYTNLSRVSEEKFVIPDEIELNDDLRRIVDEATLSFGPRMVFLNGRYESSLSRGTSKGIECEPFSVAKSFAKIDESQSDSLAALNTALLEDGITIRITEVIQEPVELLFLNQASKKAAAINTRVKIVAEKFSQATIVENYVGLSGSPVFVNGLTEIDVKEEALLHHIKVQREIEDAIHIARTDVVQARSSRFHSHVFQFGGGLCRNEIRPVLNGENIECMLNGLTVVAGKQQIDNSTTIDHAVPNAFSREAYKGIYGGQAKGAFSGTITVRQDAQKTNAIQSNQSLLLSSEATIDTRPQLKIWADDVKCTHGATVGQVDENALFYIRSRGIPESEARLILVRAFASEVVSQLPEDDIREKLEFALTQKLEKLL